MEKLIDVKQMSLNFNLREPRANKPTNLYCVVKCGTTQLKFSTGFKIVTSQWDKKRQLPTCTANMSEMDRAINASILNTISAIRFGYNEYYTYLCTNSETTTIDEIKNYFKENIINNIDMANEQNLQKGKSPKATTLLKKAFDVYYSEIRTNAKESSKNMTYNTLSAFFNYCDAIEKDAKSMLSQKGLNDFKSYLIKKSKEDKANGNKRYDSPSRINSKCETVARLINSVMVSHSAFLKYGISRVEYQQMQENHAQGENKKRRPLTDEEITKLANCNNLTDEEKEYRDLFVLECNGSYRAGDTAKLFDKSLQKTYKKGDYELIMINTQKENIDAVIWVNDTVRTILNRYQGGFKYANPTSKNYVSVYSKKLKRIFKKAELDNVETYTDAHGETKTAPLYEIIGSHFARYTFIYNGLFKMGFTPNELKDFTGHADERMINECYSVYTKDDIANNAFKALERISKNNVATNTANVDTDKVAEYKDVLAFYGEPYKNYRNITDAEELLRMIVTKYEMPLKEKGYTTKVLKQIYNSSSAEERSKYEELLKVLDEISATVAAETII